jgi:hypothetical protein
VLILDNGVELVVTTKLQYNTHGSSLHEESER